MAAPLKVFGKHIHVRPVVVNDDVERQVVSRGELCSGQPGVAVNYGQYGLGPIRRHKPPKPFEASVGR
jgi:hypothetical protein